MHYTRSSGTSLERIGQLVKSLAEGTKGSTSTSSALLDTSGPVAPQNLKGRLDGQGLDRRVGASHNDHRITGFNATLHCHHGPLGDV